MRTRRHGISNVARLSGGGDPAPAPPIITVQPNGETDPTTEIIFTVARIANYGGILEYREQGNGSWTTLVEWDTDGADPEATRNVTELSPGTVYQYRAATRYGPSDTLLSGYATGNTTTETA